MCAWSLCNQLLVLLAGTADARGYRQWQEGGRHVKKGAKSIRILASCTRRLPTHAINEGSTSCTMFDHPAGRYSSLRRSHERCVGCSITALVLRDERRDKGSSRKP